MKHVRLNTLSLCGCLVFFGAAVVSAQGQAPGHPPGAVPGAHPPAPPPNASAPPTTSSGTSGSGGTGSVALPPSVTTRTGIKLGPPGRWWDDKAYVRAVGLSKDQQKKMDGIVDANRSAIVDTYKTFLKQKAALETISKDPNVDQTKLFAAIDAVNEARAALEKANTQMLLEVRQQLDAEQVTKLDKLP